LEPGRQLGQQGAGLRSLPLAEEDAGLASLAAAGPALGQGQQAAIAQPPVFGIALLQGPAKDQLQGWIALEVLQATQGGPTAT
jgi:hypothetical protein